MKSFKKSTNTVYVTYKWLLTTIIASAASILAIVGGLANATFFTKSAGAAIIEKQASTDIQLNDMKLVLTEVRQDVKTLLARGKR